MKRVTVLLPEDLLKKLRLMAKDRGVSFSALAREAIEAKVGLYNPNPGPPSSLGIGASGYTNTARLASDFDAIIREGLNNLEKKARRREESSGITASGRHDKRRDTGAQKQ